jgi:hypothetical protein
MINSQEILAKASGPRAVELAKDKRPHAERLTDLYLVAYGRKPTADELATLTAYVEKRNGTQTAYEDVIWAVINTKEFLFNH